MSTPLYAVLFPAFEYGLREPDPSFSKEVAVLHDAGVEIHVVNIDAVMDGDMARALKHVGSSSKTHLIYRGWILHPSEYAALYQELALLGFNLLTSPEEYKSGLLLPEYFPLIKEDAIPATWIEGVDSATAIRAAKSIDGPPYYIKDYAKSAKAISPQGCIIESGCLDTEMPERIAELIEYRKDRFEGGVVIRPLVKLKELDEGPFGGIVFEEYRLFFFLGELISTSPYGYTQSDTRHLPDYSYLGQLVPSRFFTADIVVTDENEYRILEIGDGGTSALPPSLDPHHFYDSISRGFADSLPVRPRSSLTSAPPESC